MTKADDIIRVLKRFVLLKRELVWMEHHEPEEYAKLREQITESLGRGHN